MEATQDDSRLLLARCRGWVDRSARILEQTDIDCVEGYLEYGVALLRLFETGDIAGAHAHFVQAGKVGARFAHREPRRSTPSNPPGVTNGARPVSPSRPHRQEDR